MHLRSLVGCLGHSPVEQGGSFEFLSCRWSPAFILTVYATPLLDTMATLLWPGRAPLPWNAWDRCGVAGTGIPDVDVNVGDVKPTWVVPVVGLAMLALRQPLSGAKTFGNWEISQPVDAVAAVLTFPAFPVVLTARALEAQR